MLDEKFERKTRNQTEIMKRLSTTKSMTNAKYEPIEYSADCQIIIVIRKPSVVIFNFRPRSFSLRLITLVNKI